ncbi:hypothetical protein GOP47_0008994 [Adiantum capillus-veneris]|nr:hypothetical protein GOP47_0008994 [Adiantum capillus-veneris]
MPLKWRLISLVMLLLSAFQGCAGTPIVVSTWAFTDAVRAAWDALQLGFSAVDAVVEGCSACEALQCDGSVGFGGSPDENGETTLDAMIMDGTTMDVGAVAAVRNLKDAIRAAKLVLEYTEHTLLVGDQATMFALSLGLNGPSNLSTSSSIAKWFNWLENSCQPNFWRNVNPASNSSCGPYTSIKDLPSSEKFFSRKEEYSKKIGHGSHDTISMAAIDKEGKIAAGTSTNGASHKIPGRVGDGPIVGAGAYADQEVGACGATGDGDVMMRFLPCYQVVESMRLGLSPGEAAENAISRIRRKYPAFIGAIFALNMLGEHGGACHGWTFQYSVRTADMDDVSVFTVNPVVAS